MVRRFSEVGAEVVHDVDVEEVVLVQVWMKRKGALLDEVSVVVGDLRRLRMSRCITPEGDEVISL